MMEEKKILITGGSGLIGSQLVKRCLQEGWVVGSLTRRLGLKSENKRLNWIPWDYSLEPGWIEDWQDAEVIIHLAGENIGSGLWTPRKKASIHASRVRSGEYLSQLIIEGRLHPKQFIQASAVGYYGPSLTRVFEESDLPGSDWLAQVAVDWENSTKSIEAVGVTRTIIRTGVVLSRAGGVLPKMMIPYLFYLGGRMGEGTQWIPWIHIDDEVRSILHLIQNGLGGVFNLSAPQSVVNEQFAVTLGNVMGRTAWLPIPAFALRGLLGEMSTLLLDGQRVDNSRLIETKFNFRFNKLGEALTDLLSK